MPASRIFATFGLLCAVSLAAALLVVAPSASAAEVRARTVPIVVKANVPFYPSYAFGFEGEVQLRTVTDGKDVVDVHAESGLPVLVRAAIENIRTSEFEPHQPTSFETVFKYRFVTGNCSMERDSGAAILRLPKEAEVIATGLPT